MTGACPTDEPDPENAGPVLAEQVHEPAELAPEDIVAFEAAPVQGLADRSEFSVDRTYLDGVLSTWHRVSEMQWANSYSHVAGGDRSGTISLRDGNRIRWMVRPGGLAKLSFPDGTVWYGARELSGLGVDAERAGRPAGVADGG